MAKKLIDLIWEQLQQYTVIAHKTKGDNQHLYSITGIVDKKELEESIKGYQFRTNNNTQVIRITDIKEIQ